MALGIGSKLDSVMARIRQAAAERAAAAQSVKEPLPDAPDAKAVNPAEGRYLDSFEEERAKKMGMPDLAAPPPPGTDPATASAVPTNEATQAQKEQGWNAPQTTVAQTSKKGCAEATLTYLEQSSAEEAVPLTQQEAREKVRNKADTLSTSVRDRVNVNLDDGATPDEMGAMLGSMGIKVTNGFDECNTDALSGALKHGQMALAMVDSGALLNTTLAEGEKGPESGELHWLTIDGVNPGKSKSTDDDLYRVRDPINGAYWVKASDLKKSIEQAQAKHGSGGVMTVQKDGTAKTTEQREALAQSNLERTQPLGKGNGGASRRLSVGESS
ncbi:MULTISPECIES: hypothetical protein [unclassified Corallococcus]|uniref:hypothetical protein n=1 Tax=unclassified Corallococcus TaxID=2685029 RepID=UPI001A8EF4E5|nr:MULTISPECIES: hypothetical protein [unclassified Corallococcus]MBN9682783.1 hypothetical protein [Corallococcus sp. NCSPR001]WAS85678.1 hypothetical protein O0N60_01595 [Corallococcus sp. NCRR]